MNAPTRQHHGPPPAPAAGPVSNHYDAFLSYTHQDRPVAKAVQDALHRIGRRFGQLRALRVFRDDTNLEVSQDLWGKITEAMNQARFMVVVLSPLAARSKWVNAEVEHWLTRRNGPLPMIVLAGGKLVWDQSNHCFNPLLSDAAPPVLTVPGVLPVEPFFLDVGHDGPPWSASSAGFRDKMTALAAPMHGKPKDQLAGDDLREFRRTRRLRSAAIVGLALLSIVALVLGGLAFNQWQSAEEQRRAADHQRDEAIATRLTTEASSMLDDSSSGNDVQALRELLAARTVTDHPDDGALYNAVVAKRNVVRIIDAGAPAYGGTTSPDGTRLVTGGGSDQARIWDLETGKPVDPPLTGHEGPISASVWSPDGRFIVTGSLDKTVRLWNADTGTQIGRPGTHDGNVLGVAVSPNNALIATAGEDRQVRLWSVTDRGPALIKTLGVHGGAARAVAFSPDGATLASVGLDGVIKLWDVATQLPIERAFLPPPTSELLGVSWSTDNLTLATGGWDGVIRLWDATTGAQTGVLEGHTSPVINTVFIGPDFMASGSFDGTIRLWDVHGLKQVGHTFAGMDGGVAVNFATLGRLTAVSNDHTIRLLDIMVGQQIGGHAGQVSGISFSPDRDRVASASWDGTVGLYEASTMKPLGLLPGQVPATVPIDPNRRSVTFLRFGPDGRLVALRADGTVDVSDIDQSQALPQSFRVCWPPGMAALSRDGTLLAVGCTDERDGADRGAVELWKLDETPPRKVATIADGRGPIGPLAFNADGSTLAVGSNTTVQLWSTTSSPERVGPVLDEHTDAVMALVFDPTGNRLITAGADNTVRLWDAGSGEELSHSAPEGSILMSVDVSSDGNHVVTGMMNGGVRLWSIAGANVQPIGSPMTGQVGMVRAIAFRPDGENFLSGGSDGTLRLWPVGATPKELCDKLAPMSDADWAKLVAPAVPRGPACPATG